MKQLIPQNSSLITYHPLPWDSAFFGFPVARWDTTAGPDAWLPVLEKARGAGVRVLYLFAEKEIFLGEHFLKTFGGVLADTKLIYSINTFSVSENYPEIAHFKPKIPTPRLFGLSLACGQYSRFRVDPKMPKGAFEKMYCTWIERAVSGEMADVVLIAGDESDPKGVLTLKTEDGLARVGLLGVHPDFRGQGIGTKLLRTAIALANKAGAHRLEIVTQKANLAACRLYEKEGLAICSQQNVYHFWL